MPTTFSISLGDRFGKLVVEGFIGKRDGDRWWRVRCECGRTVERTAGQLKRRQSCGCLRGRGGVKHGMTNSSEFTIWQTMKARCYNPNATGYKRYGAVGITMCDEWKNSFEAFYRDIGPRPGPEYSVDRYPDKCGNYEPRNTRWATREEQGRNKATNHLLTLNDETKPLVEWAEFLQIRPDSLLARKRRGWTDERALTTALRSDRRNGPKTR